MPSYRCTTCAREWPAHKPYDDCPAGCGKTWLSPHGQPDDDYEAAANQAWRVLHEPVRERRRERNRLPSSNARAFIAWLNTVGPDDFADSLPRRGK